MQFRAFEPGIEVNGQTVYAIVDGFGTFSVLASGYLLRAGIGERQTDGTVKIQPDAWYPQQPWLTAFESIARDIGESALFKIGKRIPENAIFPPWVKDVESAIRSIDVAYHLNHRRGGEVMYSPIRGTMLEGIGHYGFKRVSGENVIVSECNNPYPCSFDHGIITTMALKFESKAKVSHDPSKPCRRNGAESCTYVVSW